MVLAFRCFPKAALNSVFAARLRAPETAERLAKSACLRLFTLIQGCPLAIAGERFALIESNCRCWGPNGVSEWVWRAGALRMEEKS